MPNVCTFYRRSDGERACFIKIDEELCAHFGQPCDKDKWLAGWYDSIAFRVAIGIELDAPEMIAAFAPGEDCPKGYPALEAIRAYLHENYVTSAHYEPK
jgi:hypothetical protein